MEQTGPTYSQFRKLEHLQENTSEFQIVIIPKEINFDRFPNSHQDTKIFDMLLR